MEYKKTIILLALVVFLLSIAGVSASEIDNTIASENANTIELSTDNDIIEDNLQTSEENMVFTSTDYDEAIAQTDTEVLGEGSAKYSDLAEEIRHSGNITLTHKNYTYDGRATAITISEANKVIDGNGAVIDMNGSTIRAFTVTASDVTIKNLTIKNANYNGDGGAIYFTSSATSGTVTNCNFTDNTADYGGAVYFWDPGTVTNCNFVNNTASEEGGAVYFWDPGTVSNCNFVDNKATGDDACGGAVYFQSTGNVTNCNFTDNTATMYGGAIFFVNTGNVTNCNFADNSAFEGGAIFSMECYTTVDTCIFKRNSGDNVNTVIYPPTLNVNNFTTVHGSGEKLTFDLKTNSSIPVTNGNISISVYFKGNGDWVRNYTCLSGEGWIPDLPVGSYIAFFDTEYAEFQEINRTITITAPEHTFWFLNYTINGNDNPVIELSHDFYFDPAYDAAFVNGIVINRPVTIKGNGNAIDAKRQARIFYVQSANAVLENLTLKNAHSNSEGGAVYFSGTGEVTNCNFTNNTATGNGGAINIGYGTVTNCNFTNNSASGDGGAINMDSGTVSNCNFTNNSASGDGGAVFTYFGSVTNCNFVNNTASECGGAVYFYQGTGSLTNCNFTNNSAQYGGAVYFENSGNVTNCNFTNNTASGDGGAIRFSSTGNVTNCNFVNNTASGLGGAVFFYQGTGSVTNCNFADNTAYRAGAVYFEDQGTVSNCNFVDNTATVYGGAVYFHSTGNVTNCNFTNNTAIYGGSVFFYDEGNVTNCNFIDNSATLNGGAVYFSSTGSVTNCNFTNNKATRNGNYEGGGAVYFYDEGTVTNCNFTNNTATSQGGAIRFRGTGTVTNCNFTGNNATNGSAIYFYSTSATKTVSNSRFLNNRANAEALEITKNDNNITITFTGRNNLLNAIYSREDAEVAFNNVTYWGAKGITTVSAKLSGSNKAAGQNITVGVVVNNELVLSDVIITNESGMIVLDISAGENYYIGVRHDADSYYTEAEKTISNNINVNVTSQTTTNKTVNITAKSNIFSEVMPGKLLFILPNNVEINATYGGNGTWWAVHTFDDYGVYQVNASYTGLINVTITNATITINKLNSTVNLDDVVLTYGETKNVTVITEGATGITATINNNPVTVINNFTIMISGLAAGNYTLTVTTIPDGDHNSVNKTVKVTVNKAHTEITINTTSLELFVGDETIILATLSPAGAGNVTFTSSNKDIVEVDDKGNIIAQGKGQAIITVSFAGDNNYTAAENKTVTINVSLADASVTVDKNNLDLKIGETYAINATKHPDTILLDITYKSSNNAVATVDENGIVTAVGEGTAIITVEVGDDILYAINSTNVTVTVSKISTGIASSAVTTVYNIEKNLIVTLKDADGKPISGAKITVDLSGAKTYTTDNNGQVKVSTKGLAAKTYTAKITFKGNEKYKQSTKDVKVTVKKATPKLTAKKKTFKTKTKTKKYTIVLKDNTGKAMKKVKVTLKVKGKTYKATTNSKGKATFKIKNLKKKGTFKAVITYKGNKNYNKVTKKVKIKVIVTFKTVSQGSKDKSTVKDIQRALKDHGYYLTYDGHYLMIDGKYNSCTVRSIKEFQHDKGLKVTGKVDEKTARKLGLI